MTPDPHDTDSPSPPSEGSLNQPDNATGDETSAPVSSESKSSSTSPGASMLGFPEMGKGSLDRQSEKTWGMLSHLLQISGIFTGGVGYAVAPLIVYLLKKNESPYVAEHARESLNFGILSFLIVFVSGSIGLSGFIGAFVGCFVGLISIAMVIANLVLVIQGTMRANEGLPYRYSFNWRLIR